VATILIVDDRSENRGFLSTLLGYFQHRILEATDGLEALAIAREERPDLIITDVLMPRMDGMELVKAIREDPALASAKIAFYTATYRMAKTREFATQCGVKHVIGKPADPEVILETVSRVLGDETPPDLSAYAHLPPVSRGE